MFESILAGAELLWRIDVFLMMGFGLMLGMFVGAMPGLTTLMALSILLPVSFFLDPLVGIPFLIGVYKGGIYGGSIPAILLAIPGTASALITTFDGPPLTRKGQARKALEMALVASVTGDFISDVVTIILIVPIALVALLIGPPELMAILVLSLIVIATSGRGYFIKGLLMMLIGLMLAVFGQHSSTGIIRYDFNWFQLRAGIPLLPMLIGLIAIPEVLLLIESRVRQAAPTNFRLREGERLKWPELRRCLPTIFRSTAIGTVIGMIPGVGQLVSSILSYAAAKNASKHPETFGQGELEGVAASEAGNNSVNGPTLVPLLTLGIPGDIATAVLLGAFVAQGLRPGPQLMIDQGPLVFAILLAMVAANGLFIVLGYFSIPLFAKIISIPKWYLLPLTLVFAFAGSFAFRANPVDLGVVAGFGLIGYLFRKADFDVAPLIMAFVLGPELERAIGTTVDLAAGDLVGFMITERPIAVALLVATPFISWWLINRRRRLGQRLTSLAGEDAAKLEAGGGLE